MITAQEAFTKAQEAKQKSLEAQARADKSLLKDIELKIEEAYARGKLSITYYHTVSSGVTKTLEEYGYTVKNVQHGMNEVATVISFENPTN